MSEQRLTCEDVGCDCVTKAQSAPRKRLSDTELLIQRDRERQWSRDGSAAWLALRRDHDQAREDRRRLAARLREKTKDGHDGNCASFYMRSVAEFHPCNCETGRLLTEVEQ